MEDLRMPRFPRLLPVQRLHIPPPRQTQPRHRPGNYPIHAYVQLLAPHLITILGFVISFCGLFVWLEFGTMIPRSGGEKVYLEAVYKKPKFLATVIFATNAILLGFTAAGCIVSSWQPPSTKR